MSSSNDLRGASAGAGGKEKGREKSWDGGSSPTKGRKEAMGGDGIGRLDA